jgi:hypothetical protein
MRTPSGRRLTSLTISPWKAEVELLAQEAHDILGAEGGAGMAHQAGIEPVKRRLIAKQHVRGVLRLIGDPVVVHHRQQVVEQRIEPSSEAVQGRGPVESSELVRETLRPLRTRDRDEGVVAVAEHQAQSLHAASQPLVAVDVDLHREREPRRSPHVDEAEHGVDQVEVVNQALAPCRLQVRTICAHGQAKRLHRLDGTEDTDQPASNTVLAGDLSRELLLAHESGEIPVRATCVLGYQLRVGLQAAGDVERQLLEFLEPDAHRVHPGLQALGVADRQMAFEDHPVETGQTAHDPVAMLHDEAVHGASVSARCGLHKHIMPGPGAVDITACLLPLVAALPR